MYVGDADNRFAFAFEQLNRYLRFLHIVKNRHGALQDRVRVALERRMEFAKSNSGRRMTDAEAMEWEEEREVSEHLHLEMESFFQFAYVALTKAARVIEWYFGPERGFSFRSHKEWTKSARKYCALKGLDVPDHLFPILERCLNEITEPRSHDVVHGFNPRALFGTAFSADGDARRMTTHLYPTERDSQLELLPVTDAYRLISDYTGCLAQLIVENRDRGHLKLVAVAT